MSFRQNLIRARSHITFLVALGLGLALVITLENTIDTRKAAQMSADEKRAADAMTPNPYTCDPDDTLEEVMNMMVEHNIRHLPVVYKGRLEGVGPLSLDIRRRGRGCCTST